MKKRMAVIMALVMILACSLAAAEQIIPVFSLQDALKKGMSPEQVAQSIGTEPGYQQQLTENTLDVEYVLGSGDQAVYAALLFVDNRLTMVGCSGFAGNAADSLASLKEAMTREYGLPADVTPTAVAHLFSTISGSPTPLNFTNAARWQVDEALTAMAFIVAMPDDLQPYVVYVSTEYLASIGTTDALDEALAGTWILTDVSRAGASEAELQQMRDMITSGEISYVYIFDCGRVEVIMRQATPGADPVENRLTGFYQISGNQLTVTAEGSSPGDAITFAAEGDRLEMTLYGTTMILTRQNYSK